MIETRVRKALKEAYEPKKEVNPEVYVGTYGKYNSGSIAGQWVDLTQFASKEDFLKYCYKLHKDERDPEFMFQDYQGIPDIFIDESFIDERFWDYMEDTEHPDEVKRAVADHVSNVNEYFDSIDDAYFYPDCDDMTDVAYYVVNELDGGPENLKPETLAQYFDYEAYGNNLDTSGTWIKTDNGYVEMV